MRKRLRNARHSGNHARDAMAAFYGLVMYCTNFFAAMTKVTGTKYKGAKGGLDVDAEGHHAATSRSSTHVTRRASTLERAVQVTRDEAAVA